MKYNTRLKYSHTTPFLLNKYLLECDKHILNVFSTENLSIYHKILTGLKDQFDLHKLLHFFMKIRPAPYLYWCSMVKAEEIVIFRIKGQEYLIRHFQSNGVDNHCIDWALSRANLFLTKIIWCFLCFVDIFCYLEHSSLLPRGSCLLVDCQLQNVY